MIEGRVDRDCRDEFGKDASDKTLAEHVRAHLCLSEMLRDEELVLPLELVTQNLDEIR